MICQNTVRLRLLVALCGLLLVAGLQTGCKSGKAAGKSKLEPVAGTTDAAKAAPILGVTILNNLEFKTLSIKGKFDYNGASSIKASYKMNMEYGKRIWVSFSMLGIEGARVLATPDSVYFMNKLEKQYFIGDYASLEKRVGFPVSFTLLQDMFIGNLSVEADKLNFVSSSGENFVYQAVTGSPLATKYTLSGNQNKVTNVELSHPGGTTARLMYSEFETTASKKVPHHLSVTSNSSFLKTLDLNHDAIEVNPGSPSFSFTIPANYTQLKF